MNKYEDKIKDLMSWKNNAQKALDKTTDIISELRKRLNSISNELNQTRTKIEENEELLNILNNYFKKILSAGEDFFGRSILVLISFFLFLAFLNISSLPIIASLIISALLNSGLVVINIRDFVLQIKKINSLKKGKNKNDVLKSLDEALARKETLTNSREELLVKLADANNLQDETKKMIKDLEYQIESALLEEKYQTRASMVEQPSVVLSENENRGR